MERFYVHGLDVIGFNNINYRGDKTPVGRDKPPGHLVYQVMLYEEVTASKCKRIKHEYRIQQ